MPKADLLKLRLLTEAEAEAMLLDVFTNSAIETEYEADVSAETEETQ